MKKIYIIKYQLVESLHFREIAAKTFIKAVRKLIYEIRYDLPNAEVIIL